MSKEKVQEFVSMPFSLTIETTIDGINFYSSDNLKSKFVQAFEKSSKGNHIAKEIGKLVEQKLITPCYLSKNLFSFIRRKLFSGPEKYILAFYHVDEKKVIVLIENKVSIFGTAANNTLVSTTMHESMHLAAGLHLSGFMRIFKRHLRTYYTEFISEYFAVDNPTMSKVDSLIKYISNFEKQGPDFVNKNLSDYFHFFTKLFLEETSLSNKEFEDRLTKMIVALKLFIVHMPTFINNIRNYNMLLSSLNRAYENAFSNKNTFTTPIQELMTLSEIACVLSEMSPKESSIKQIFKLIS